MMWVLLLMLTTARLDVGATNTGPPALQRSKTERVRKIELARALCAMDAGKRQKAINAIVASPGIALPWLLEWAKCPLRGASDKCKDPPPRVYGVESVSLFYSMAEVFGRLRTKEAVPSLIENISVDLPLPGRSRMPITTRAPAIKALLQIGPPATPALLRALAKLPYCDSCEHAIDRLAMVLTLAFLDDPRARPALEEASKYPGWEGQVAAEGLQRLGIRK